MEKQRQATNWYRKIWIKQTLERIIHEICPWNPGYTARQLKTRFEKPQHSGVYEIKKILET